MCIISVQCQNIKRSVADHNNIHAADDDADDDTSIVVTCLSLSFLTQPWQTQAFQVHQHEEWAMAIQKYWRFFGSYAVGGTLHWCIDEIIKYRLSTHYRPTSVIF